MAMAVIILVLFFSAGVLAEQHQPPALKFRQDSSDIGYRKFPSALAGELSVQIHQDDSDFVNESDSHSGESHITVKSEVQSPNEDFEDDDSGCDFPFVRIADSCYFFSSEQLSFVDAEDYCETLSQGHINEVTLAMMDYSVYEDQALMDAVTERNNTFWIGGATEDGVQWSWLDDRPISLQATYWYYTEPDTPTNKCVTAQVQYNGNNVRSYIFDAECDVSLNFICQARFPFNFNFRRIGNNNFFLSDEVGLPHAHWQEARQYCKSLMVPLGYYSDLAVLSMTQDDNDLMYNFVPADTTGYYYAWIGAVAENGDCVFNHIDGRPLFLSSTYWYFSQPTCGDEKFVALRYYAPYNKTTLDDSPESKSFPFICQMFPN